MPVKLVNGKVLLVGGKVCINSACCCETDCCLYPSPDPLGLSDGPFYPNTDLPDTIVVNGETLAKNPGTYSYGTLSFSSTFIYSGSATADGIPLEPSSAWVLYVPPREEFVFNTCLVGTWAGWPDEVEDEFSESYAVTFLSASPDGDIHGTITRASKCRWEGLGSDGPNSWNIVLEFLVDATNVLPGGYLIWKLSAISATNPEQPTGWKLPSEGENQSSPVGSYFTESPVVTVGIVS